MEVFNLAQMAHCPGQHDTGGVFSPEGGKKVTSPFLLFLTNTRMHYSKSKLLGQNKHEMEEFRIHSMI